MPTTPRFSRRAALAQMARYAAAASAVAPPVSAFVQPPETPPDAVPNGQDAPPPLPDPAATIAQIEAEQFAQSLDNEEGYSGWKQHIGKPEDAVVHARVTTFEGGTSGAGQTTREGSGVICRCDGFVLLPETLFGDDRALQKTAKISLSFRAADGEMPSTPLEPVAPPQYHSAKTDYVLVKVNGHHFKGLHLLDVRNVTNQMPVTVIWAAPPGSENAKKNVVNAAPDGTGNSNGRPAIGGAAQTGGKSAGLPVAKRRSATVGERLAGSVPHVELHWTETEGELPPMGAAVIEPSSGGVLGIITEVRPNQVAFSPFGYFQYVCNEIGLKVSIEDITAPTSNTRGTVTGTGQMLSMVKVSGGPTRLSGELANTYRGLYRTDVVCMPDFYIDAHPVTVGIYRDWLGNGGPRQPLGWVENVELQTRQRNPDLPVTGLIADDALRFAAGHKKRLATPVEWARAGIGGKTRWILDLIKVWSKFSASQKGARANKVKAYTDELVKLSTDRNGRPIPNFKPPLGISAPSPTLDMWSAIQQKSSDDYWKVKGRWFPYQHSPVGFYKDDESKWGVMEMVSNAPEICQPNYAARAYEPAYKPYATRVDPYYSTSNYFGWLANCQPGDMDGNFADCCVTPEIYIPHFDDKGRDISDPDHTPYIQQYNDHYVYYKDGLYVIGVMNVLPRTGFGFRCAL